MEGNSWRPAMGEPASATEYGSSADWRAQLPPAARQKIVEKITNTLKRHLAVSALEGGLNELQQIAIQFENKLYAAAVNQHDYLRKISLKMLSMENKSRQSASTNPSMPNNTVANQNPAESASLGLPLPQSNQGQSLSISSQQHLPQNIQNNTSVMASDPANFPSALSSITGLSQSISGVSQTSNLQNMPGTHNVANNNTSGQTTVSDFYANIQSQIQGKQQQQINSQQQYQSQNQFLHQHQLNQEVLKQKLQHSSLLQPHVQQQQPLLQTNKPQSSQQPLVQMSSNLQTGQSTVQQIQLSEQSDLQQNQPSSVDQSVPSLLQQHPQSVLRKQHPSQPTTPQQKSSTQQQPNSASQQSNLSMQQHQQLLMQANISNVQQTQQLGQQMGVTEMQQRSKRMLVQQNNILTMQQHQHLLNQQTIISNQPQQLVAQSHISGLQQSQQQHRFLGSLPNISNMQSHQHPMHMLHQSKAVVKQQQKNQQAPVAMLQPQCQRPQHQLSQQQLISQFPSQPAQLQQPLAQLHPNSLQRDMQQRLQASGSLLSQNAIEQQKQFCLSQGALTEVSSSTSLDSTAQTGRDGAIDWQEEIYQKVKSMRELYFEELKELYQRIALKLQQFHNDALASSGKTSEPVEQMKNYKMVLEHVLQVLQLSKSNIQPGLKGKLAIYEKQIIDLLATDKKKPTPSQPPGQQKFQPPGNSQPMTQQKSSQVFQLQHYNNYINQQMNLQGSTIPMHPASVSNMQQNSVTSAPHSSVPTSQQNTTNILQTGPAVDPVQGNSFNSLQQGTIAATQRGALASGQNAIDVPQLSNTSMSHSSMNSLRNNVNSKQPSSSTTQQHHFNQQQQQNLMQNQQLKQPLQQCHMQKQLIHQLQKQQLLQSQQPLQQQLQQQLSSRIPVQHFPRFHQTNEINELKFRQGAGIKPEHYQQHYSTGQRHNYYQQLKTVSSFSISSPQDFQASSPQISQYSSPQIDQPSPLSSQIKSGTPLPLANSPLTPSTSTPIAPSPILVESEKQHSGTPLPNEDHIGHQQTAIESSQAQSVAIATHGISTSPFLAEVTSADGNQTNLLNLLACKTSTARKPLECIIEVIQSSTPKALGSAVSDIGSVVCMMDKIAGSAPGNGSKAVIGEDLVAMARCRLQASSFMPQDGSATNKKMKRDMSTILLNNFSPDGILNDTFKQSYGFDPTELESTATSHSKQQKVEVNHAVLEEIREINLRLINTLVSISEEDCDSISAALDGEGTVVKCFFTAVALCPSLKSHFASENMSPILPLRLLVPANYPKYSPVLMDKLLDDHRESNDLSVKARSRFITSIGGLSQPISLGQMVKIWDACTRRVLTEFAQQSGGGTFSSRYGTWENGVGA